MAVRVIRRARVFSASFPDQIRRLGQASGKAFGKKQEQQQASIGKGRVQRVSVIPVDVASRGDHFPSQATNLRSSGSRKGRVPAMISSASRVLPPGFLGFLSFILAPVPVAGLAHGFDSPLARIARS